MATATEPRAPSMGTQIVPFQQRMNSVHDLLERMKPQLATALPKHLTADRMTRVALTAIRKVPRLAECTQESLAGAIMTAAQLGLEPDGMLGHFYLIPFKNNEIGAYEVQGIIGYRGMVDLARRSGQISTVYATVVREGDEFSHELGTEPRLIHRPHGSTGAVTHAYAVAKLKDGATQFDVMTLDEIKLIRSRSRTAQKGPWVTDWEEMAKKSVVRRLWKMLPVNVEYQRAVVLEEQHERGIVAVTDVVTELEYKPADTALEAPHDEEPTPHITQDEAPAPTDEAPAPTAPTEPAQHAQQGEVTWAMAISNPERLKRFKDWLASKGSSVNEVCKGFQIRNLLELQGSEDEVLDRVVVWLDAGKPIPNEMLPCDGPAV